MAPRHPPHEHYAIHATGASPEESGNLHPMQVCLVLESRERLDVTNPRGTDYHLHPTLIITNTAPPTRQGFPLTTSNPARADEGRYDLGELEANDNGVRSHHLVPLTLIE